MAEAFNTDVESMQLEASIKCLFESSLQLHFDQVAKLIGQRQLDAKIDSHRKILHASHADHRRSTCPGESRAKFNTRIWMLNILGVVCNVNQVMALHAFKGRN